MDPRKVFTCLLPQPMNAQTLRTSVYPMFDAARASGMNINVQRLSQLLGVPVVPTVATKNEGIKELIARTAGQAEEPRPAPLKIDYGREIEEEAAKLEKAIRENPALAGKYPSRWLAIKLLEGDKDLLREVEEGGAEAVLAQLAASNQRLRAVFGDGVEAAIAERRYGFISGLLKEVVSRRSTGGLSWPSFSALRSPGGR